MCLITFHHLHSNDLIGIRDNLKTEGKTDLGSKLIYFLHRVHTFLNSSNSTSFHDFSHGHFKFSKTLGLAVTFKTFKNFPCSRVLLDL